MAGRTVYSAGGSGNPKHSLHHRETEVRQTSDSLKQIIIAGTALVSSGLSVLILLIVSTVSPLLTLGLAGGIGGSVLGLVALRLSSPPRRPSDEATAVMRSEELLTEFSRLEDEVRVLAIVSVGEYAESLSLTSMITLLEDHGYWSGEKSDTFRKILRVRNSILHEGKIPSTTAVDSAIRSIHTLHTDLPRVDRSGGMTSVTTLRSAISTFRRLAVASPDRYRPDLAASLSNLGASYSELGRPADALPAEQEAVAIRRELAATNPDRYRPDLAASLSNLGASYSELGRPADALPADQEAVAIRRELAATSPDRYRPDLAASLSNLGVSYSELGRPADALPVTEEAVAIRRELAATNPDRYRPGLARSLSNLGVRYSELGRPADALPVTEEPVAIRRELAATNPDRYRPDLAASLSNLGVSYSELGRGAEAQAADAELRQVVRDLESA